MEVPVLKRRHVVRPVYPSSVPLPLLLYWAVPFRVVSKLIILGYFHLNQGTRCHSVAILERLSKL